ncbi:MAG TPA: peptidoglycan DD-metalloendopeptidase family protein, partial [Nitriliruptorales bacterium]|nr:peptidoglycan DD-metalloendopeptidase family protein [Nitriliruptorales bacterium]
DPPPEPWGAGHRGVDLAARRGEPVSAAADGVVAFAARVAGPAWVSVDHPDGVRTAYGPLTAVAVTAGSRVARGARLGTVASGHDPRRDVLHWSARRGGVYLDPLALLVATGWRPALVGPGGSVVTDLPVVPSYAPWIGRRGLAGRLGFVEGSPPAQHAGWVLPPNPNHVIGVAGLGSRTGRLPVDLRHLGYRPGDVTYLSYAGRHDRPGAPDDPQRDQRRYDPAATFRGVDAAARHLRRQLRVQQRRAPGRAVDLVGHSMGGVVVLHYLLTLHDPADPELPPIGHVVTLASPLEGADLAGAVQDAARDVAVRTVLDAVAGRAGMPRHDAPTVADLAVGSELVAQLAEAWAAAREDVWSGPLAGGTQVLTVGASRDVVVAEHRSDLPGAPHAVLPGGHHGMRRTEASRILLRAFLADEPIPGQPGGLGHWLSYPLGWGEQVAGQVLGGPGS